LNILNVGDGDIRRRGATLATRPIWVRSIMRKKFSHRPESCGDEFLNKRDQERDSMTRYAVARATKSNRVIGVRMHRQARKTC
jgi:hypothetical protein